MLELYQAYADYRSMMDLTEGLIVACVQALGGGMKLPFGEHTIDFTPPWQRASYADLFRQHVGVYVHDEPGLRRVAEAKGFPTAGKHPDVIVHHLFEENVEDKLVGPVFVYDYPAGLCPLTKRKRTDPSIAERFELYVRGMELANAYTELNDPDHAGGDLPPPAGRAAGRGVDGEDGRGFRLCPAAWHAAGGRPGHRHRPAGDAADQHTDDPRRDPVPAAAAGEEVTASPAPAALAGRAGTVVRQVKQVIG